MKNCQFWGPDSNYFAQRLMERGILVQADGTGYQATFPDEGTMEAYLCEVRAEMDSRKFFLTGE
ncbi:hypothetical protein [Desmospora profundinema]|uniref:Uncharacterized protein n=1 Tax=Desmospora profundinema TaxID=1571184 RepID=A0ABU1IRL8_9BACL|nr:hypothetical protein [Desmospora profundinema]MDR6227442.1 hypothetical protein [Desmospora profundinema]